VFHSPISIDGRRRARPRAALVATVLLASAAPAIAADADGNYAVKGAGMARCADFLAARERGDEKAVFMFAGWAEGFVSAANLYEDDTFDAAPWQGTDVLAVLLSAACRRTPDDAFHLAVARVMRELFPARLDTASARVVVGEGERELVIYDAVVGRVRRRLAALDYLDAAEPDAGWNASAADALGRFQADRGLDATRVPDQLTLLYLFTDAGSDGD